MPRSDYPLVAASFEQLGGAYGIWLALGLFAGASLTIQALVNSSLRAVLGSPLKAGLVSYIGGTLFCLAFLLIRRESLSTLNGRTFADQPFLWVGGLYGLIYLLITVWLLPRIPSTQVFALIVAGQLLSALVFEHFGFLGAVARPVDASKLFGVALLVAAVILIRR